MLQLQLASALMHVVERLKSWLSLGIEQQRLQSLKARVEGQPRKRKPFKPHVALPWYSLSRKGNIMLLAGLCTLGIFWDSVKMTYKSIKYSVKLERERRAFLKELDEEDRLLEQRDAAAVASTTATATTSFEASSKV